MRVILADLMTKKALVSISPNPRQNQLISAINGAGMRDIERVLYLSTNTILKTLREAAKRADEPAHPRRVRDLEIDEFWSFVGAKRRRRWIWCGYDRQRRNVVAFVNEWRTDAACRQLLQKLDGCQITRYHTDNWQSYAKLLPTRRHRTGKEGTSRIERHNLNFRTRLKRFQRHTICYSKSAVIHDAVINLYVHHSLNDENDSGLWSRAHKCDYLQFRFM